MREFQANGCCSLGVKYFATFLCAIAVYIGPGINLTWLNVNVAPHYRRATAIGFQQSMGNTAGIVAGQIYRTAPYKLGNSFSLGALCVSQVLIAGKILYIKRENGIKEKLAGGLMEDNRKVKTGDRECKRISGSRKLLILDCFLSNYAHSRDIYL